MKKLGPIEFDHEYKRTYIPLPGGFEVQTKGVGSSFRIFDKEMDFRLSIQEQPYLHGLLERMAIHIHRYVKTLEDELEKLRNESSQS